MIEQQRDGRLAHDVPLFDLTDLRESLPRVVQVRQIGGTGAINHSALAFCMTLASETGHKARGGWLRSTLLAGQSGLSGLARLALDVALPTLCVACREPVHGEGVCAACWSKLDFIAPPFCERLGIPFVYDPGPGVLSMEAIAEPPAYQRARAAVRYNDTARQLVHGLKYHDRTDLAPSLGRWMARAGANLLAGSDVIVPVPLHWRRGWARRYNQSGALAAVIGRQSGVKVAPAALKRVKPTLQQTGLSRTERARNVQGAFQVPTERRGEIQGRRIVVIDDVLTTGATLDACARALRRAGAADVDALVFARVVEAGRSPI